MKLVQLGLLMALTACGSLNKGAELNTEKLINQPRSVITANLETINLDPKLNINQVYSASITIDEKGQEALLFLSTCPPKAFCIYGGPTYTAKIISDKMTSCGVREIEAKTDSRPVDGALTTLSIRDNSKSICEIAYPGMTQVTLGTAIFDRINGEEITTQSTFVGKKALANLKR